MILALNSCVQDYYYTFFDFNFDLSNNRVTNIFQQVIVVLPVCQSSLLELTQCHVPYGDPWHTECRYTAGLCGSTPSLAHHEWSTSPAVGPQQQKTGHLYVSDSPQPGSNQ